MPALITKQLIDDVIVWIDRTQNMRILWRQSAPDLFSHKTLGCLRNICTNNHWVKSYFGFIVSNAVSKQILPPFFDRVSSRPIKRLHYGRKWIWLVWTFFYLLYKILYTLEYFTPDGVLPGYDGDCSTWVRWRLFYLGSGGCSTWEVEAVLPEYDGSCSTWVGWRLSTGSTSSCTSPPAATHLSMTDWNGFGMKTMSKLANFSFLAMTLRTSLKYDNLLIPSSRLMIFS